MNSRALLLALWSAVWMLAGCRARHPPFPEVPSEPIAIAEPAPRAERRAEYFDAAATKKRHEWHVLVAPGRPAIADGEDLEWWPNGELRSSRRFDHGRAVGEWKTWYEDGVARSACTLGSDEPTPMSWWYPNGRLSSQGSAKDGARSGHWTSWYDTGAKQSEGDYVDNRRSGTWTFYDASGAAIETAEYVGGIKTSSERTP